MGHFFVDESKNRVYTLVAAIVAPADASQLRKAVSALVLPGQRRLHFMKESGRRRRTILSTLEKLGVSAHVFQSDSRWESDAREDCLTALVAYAKERSHSHLVLERADSVEKDDRRVLYREIEAQGMRESCSYECREPYGEPLLWIPDAIAWSYAKGGDWKRRIRPMLTGVSKAPRP